VATRDLEVRDVRLFLTLLRERSLLAASKKLGVDHSTLGRRLSALELTLGVTLFVRGPDGLVPTDEAQRLEPLARAMTGSAEAFARAAREPPSAVSGTVKITAPAAITSLLLVPRLAGLHLRHPELDIELLPEARLLDLEGGEADLALRLVNRGGHGVVSRRWLRSKVTVLCARALSDEAARARRLSELPWITGLVGMSPEEDAFFTAHGLRARLRIAGYPSRVAAVSAGLGAALFPRAYVGAGDIVEPPLGADLRAATKDLPNVEVFVAYHARSRRNARVRAVIDTLFDAEITEA